MVIWLVNHATIWHVTLQNNPLSNQVALILSTEMTPLCQSWHRNVWFCIFVVYSARLHNLCLWSLCSVFSECPKSRMGFKIFWFTQIMIWSVPSQETTYDLIIIKFILKTISGFCVKCTSKYVVSATWLLSAHQRWEQMTTSLAVYAQILVLTLYSQVWNKQACLFI